MFGYLFRRADQGEVVAALAPKGIVPKKKEVEPVFGSFPSRYSPLDYHPKVIRS